MYGLIREVRYGFTPVVAHPLCLPPPHAPAPRTSAHLLGAQELVRLAAAHGGHGLGLRARNLLLQHGNAVLQGRGGR